LKRQDNYLRNLIESHRVTIARFQTQHDSLLEAAEGIGLSDEEAVERRRERVRVLEEQRVMIGEFRDAVGERGVLIDRQRVLLASYSVKADRIERELDAMEEKRNVGAAESQG